MIGVGGGECAESNKGVVEGKRAATSTHTTHTHRYLLERYENYQRCSQGHQRDEIAYDVQIEYLCSKLQVYRKGCAITIRLINKHPFFAPQWNQLSSVQITSHHIKSDC